MPGYFVGDLRMRFKIDTSWASIEAKPESSRATGNIPVKTKISPPGRTNALAVSLKITYTDALDPVVKSAEAVNIL